jgi:hypothetical protein
MKNYDYHNLNAKISEELDQFLLAKYEALPQCKHVKELFDLYLKKRIGKTRSRDCWTYFMAKIMGIDVEKDKQKKINRNCYI